ncbi:MAG: hypothetical protein ABIH90_00285, partial [Candidatus Aenigmatarchaeota archaeon]
VPGVEETAQTFSVKFETIMSMHTVEARSFQAILSKSKLTVNTLINSHNESLLYAFSATNFSFSGMLPQETSYGMMPLQSSSKVKQSTILTASPNFEITTDHGLAEPLTRTVIEPSDNILNTSPILHLYDETEPQLQLYDQKSVVYRTQPPIREYPNDYILLLGSDFRARDLENPFVTVSDESLRLFYARRRNVYTSSEDLDLPFLMDSERLPRQPKAVVTHDLEDDTEETGCYAATHDDSNYLDDARRFIGNRKELSFEVNSTRTLDDYVRNGAVLDGFKLATSITVEPVSDQPYMIDAFNTKTGQTHKFSLNGNSAYAHLDRGLAAKGLTPAWENYFYIDTETGDERSGLYLKTILETDNEAKTLLGDKDKHGMELSGIIVLINGHEPGGGTTPLHNYSVLQGDSIDVVYKNDSAFY